MVTITNTSGKYLINIVLFSTTGLSTPLGCKPIVLIVWEIWNNFGSIPQNEPHSKKSKHYKMAHSQVPVLIRMPGMYKPSEWLPCKESFHGRRS